MKPLVAVPDMDRLVRDLLTDLVADAGEDVTVGVGVPQDWTPTSRAHLQVDWNGILNQDRPVIAKGLVRIVARAASTSEAKRLAALAEGLLTAHTGGSGITSIHESAGVLAERDSDTNAELAAITVRVTVRLTPILIGS